MSGHSKWSTIKHQKGANDAKRGATFTKLANAITIAVREGGGGDINFNFRLRLAIDKAREVNMPKDNIQRSVNRGLGIGESTTLETILYEGFAPHGVAVLAECVTDNRNRANGEIRTVFVKNGGAIGSSGSVGYLFKRVGEIKINKPSESEGKTRTSDDVLEIVMEVGGEDFSEDSENYYAFTTPETLHLIKTELEKSGLTISFAALVYLPNKETLINITDHTQAEDVLNFIEKLEELDDVQNVYSNLG